MKLVKVTKINPLGLHKTIDLEVDHPDHNYYAEGIVVSNSHSYSYGYIAAQTVYLKHKYPQQFFLACLRIASTKSDFIDEFRQIQQELPHFGIKLLPPHVGKSDLSFKIEGQDIRFGLGEIKGIAGKTIDKLRDFLSSDNLSDLELFEAAKRASINIGALSSLIQSGALGHNVYDRSSKVLEAQVWNILTPKEKLYCLENGSSYNGNLIDMLKNYLNWTDSNGKKFTKESRLETIRKKSDRFFKIYNLNHRNELFACYFYEKTLIGFSYSTTLKEIFGDGRNEIRNIGEIQQFVALKESVDLVATVSEVKSGVSKNKNPYLRLSLFDETGSINAMLMNDKLARYLDKFEAPQEDDIVFISGKKGDDIIWIDFLEIQTHKVYTKLSELTLEEKEQQ